MLFYLSFFIFLIDTFNEQTDNKETGTAYQTMQIVKEILNLVHYHFNFTLEHQHLDYKRFIIYLQHFA